MSRKSRRERREAKGRVGSPAAAAGVSGASGPTRSRLDLAICLVLLAADVLVFGQVRGHTFIHLDDHLFVGSNAVVQAGLTLRGLGWAFTTTLTGNWQPLTWLSHMLDVQLHGLDAGRHLLTNVALHGASAVVLFLTLRRATGARWRSAVVAALFLVHPLHVESVAWVAERKDVLSGLFFTLALWSYVRAAGAGPPSPWRVAAPGALMALGLMAKPMLVTLPGVLLLLDAWPLGRLGRQRSLAEALRPLVVEKLPLFALSLASSAVTLLAQQQEGAIPPASRLGLALRAGTALTAYARYLGQLVWPSDLSVFYPYDPSLPATHVLAAAALLAVVTGLAASVARRWPWVPVGWLWFVGMLVPVIGIVQVGTQSMADRYTYLPSIGLFVAAVWTASDLLARRRRGRELAAALGAAVLLSLAVACSRQVALWRDSFTLFRHGLAVTGANHLLENNLGQALLLAGRASEAIPHLERAVRIAPWGREALANLGLALMMAGRVEDALARYAQLVRLDPASPEGRFAYGSALAQARRHEEAIAELSAAVRLNPDYAEARQNLGLILLREGRLPEALEHLTQAVRLAPGMAAAHNSLGSALFTMGRTAEALAEFEVALRLDPSLAAVRRNVAQARARLRDEAPRQP